MEIIFQDFEGQMISYDTNETATSDAVMVG